MRWTLSLFLTALLACGTSTPEPEAPPEAPAEEPAEAPEEAPEPAADTPEEAAELPAKVNLNTASEAEFLEKVPELGKKMAHEFEEYRPYASVTQFEKEMGKYVDEAKIEAYLTHVYVPIAYNDCDAATLQQLDLTAEAAQALMDGRPYADKAAFLEALKGHASEAVVAQRADWIAEP